MRSKIHSFAQMTQFPRREYLRARKSEAGDLNRMRLPQWISAALYRTPSVHCSAQPTVSTSFPMEAPVFNPKKILILSKVTRYEFERKTNPRAREPELEDILRRRGSDFSRLKTKHEQHHAYVKAIQDELERAGVQSRVVQRWDYTDAAVKWADCIFSAGGDGTFLLAASRVRNSEKPVIGINTDPQGSEGYMCLMRKLPKENMRSAFDRLFSGSFEWLFRQRIRISVTGDEMTDSIELHDQQMNRKPSITRWTDNPREPGEQSSQYYDPPPVKCLTKNGSERVTVELPVLALNEVFLGESLSSRVSYYELQVDGGQMVKQKSSGITICTGTGSTSWYFNINKLTDKCVTELLSIVQDRCKVELPCDDTNVINDICTRFNQQLIFDPHLPRMAFSVRDPVFNATFLPSTPRGFAEKIRVKSRGYDAHLVVDGGVSYRFNDGAEAVFEMREDDALRTVIFR